MRTGTNSTEFSGKLLHSAREPVVAVYYSPIHLKQGSSISGRLAGYLMAQTNARSFEWMLEALRRYTSTECSILRVDAKGQVDETALRNAGTIVLLWPDPNGIGWGSVEAQVQRCRGAETKVLVLNGRRRLFDCFGSQARNMRFHRMLEETFVFNALFTVAIFAVAAPLAACDRLMNRT